MLLTKLFTRSRLLEGDALGSISVFEWFGWFGLNPCLSGDGDGKGEGEGEENGEDAFFMKLFTELVLSRLRRRGAESSSGLKKMVGLEGLPFSRGRCTGDEGGEANGDAKVFTKLFTLSRFREGEWESSEGGSWLFESEEKENGESTGEKNGEGSGVAIRLADGIFKEGGTREGRGERRGKPRSLLWYPRRRQFTGSQRFTTDMRPRRSVVQLYYSSISYPCISRPSNERESKGK